ncbi:hypothetical protein ACWEPL_64665 [Nonomuraea sp. NPDC004186]
MAARMMSTSAAIHALVSWLVSKLTSGCVRSDGPISSRHVLPLFSFRLIVRTVAR